MANKYTAMPLPPKEELENMYHIQMLSQVEIGKEYGTTQKVVFSWFRKLGIKSRIPAKRNQIGEHNDSWRGDSATYSAFHRRVEARRGKPKVCFACGDMNKAVYEWCNLTGRYEDTNDYMRMCRKCHRQYDKNRKNSSKHVRKRAK